MSHHRTNLWIMAALCCAGCTPIAAQATPSATLPAAASPTLQPAPTPTSAVPSVTPSPAPAPRLFTETFDGALPYWSFLQGGNDQPAVSPAVRDGFLVFDLPAPNQWIYAIYGGPYYTDVIIEGQAQFRTGGDGSAGILCRYDAQKGWYELNVFADQTYELLYGQWLSPGVAAYMPLYRGRSDAIRVDENTIGLECRGNTLTPFINGQPMNKWPESKFKLLVGRVGVAVASFENAPFTIAFDSVRVSKP